ncbi:glycerate kinase [Agromyces sp. Soil535]|uniref:glycerate kinase n=1 Tax=Agromyces sp. Soil535 TaxID=1736390 RepID=UPI0006F3FD0D|nr:glycerate kinase [Agromyces sp. Soil535]KRE29094.1 glycerate kinase [Agromyces sp. Soil535]
MSRVVIAPDSFKGTASAADAAAALAAGWRTVRPADELELRPMADGGEGTMDAFASAVRGARRVPIRVRGPVSAPVDTAWLLLPDGTGVVELAATSGITLLDPLAPLDAHTAGFGEAIAAALDAGVERLLLALGGSASSDGGVGALAVLGGRFLDTADRPVPLGNRGLGMLARVDLSGLRPWPAGGAVILGDVTNLLLGELGAAAVFGPQKGADAATVDVLEENLARLAGLMPAPLSPLAGAPGAGAAGGTGFGLLAWGAEMGGGASLVAQAVGLGEAIAGADLVITGEGRFDGQSEAGKAPTVVAGLARDAGVPAALVAGAIAAEPRGFTASVALADLAGGGAAAMAEPLRWLEAAGAELARTS